MVATSMQHTKRSYYAFQGAALDIREERRIRNNRILLYVAAVGITSYGLLLFLGLM